MNFVNRFDTVSYLALIILLKGFMSCPAQAARSLSFKASPAVGKHMLHHPTKTKRGSSPKPKKSTENFNHGFLFYSMQDKLGNFASQSKFRGVKHANLKFYLIDVELPLLMKNEICVHHFPKKINAPFLHLILETPLLDTTWMEYNILTL
ncbi:hypothetical protein [Legionella saoudiensis]|uniref:hypothetical protein n=1 Tax=Legionella saoudiensis TaxID=1750561 RepID=UPI0007317029|nr:hypothetical protein [Legionella saoudiensis]